MVKTNTNVEKYRKIMAMANRTNFPQERMVALRKAEKLLEIKEVAAAAAAIRTKPIRTKPVRKAPVRKTAVQEREDFNYAIRAEVAMLTMFIVGPIITLVVIMLIIMDGLKL